METLETSRLVLRPFTTDDFEAVQAYAGDLDNVKFMEWGPNEPAHTRTFIQMAIDKAGDVPCRDYQYAVVLKESGGVIGGCSLTRGGRSDASLGWILHKSHWKKGYGTELGKRLLVLAFDGLGLHRVTARCHADNYGSYRVMERIGLRREGLFIESEPPNKLTNEKYGNEYMYGILKQEWDDHKDTAGH